MAKVFSIALFVTVLACNSVFANEATECAELKKTENVEIVASDVVVEEVL